jgi:hypothetical protein
VNQKTQEGNVSNTPISNMQTGIFRRLRKNVSAGGALGGAGFGDLLEIFQPTRHHIVIEAERKRNDIMQSPSPDDKDKLSNHNLPTEQS